MDLKQEAARAGASLITDQKRVGLGDGSTIGFLVEELQKKPAVAGRIFFTSSEKTRRMLAEAGLPTAALTETAQIDIYFDGCDQVDHGLNALKSGSGIHTMEKLVASMAEEFILLVDESKYVPQFDGRFPLVVELIPEALSFIQHQLAGISPGVQMQQRENEGLPVVTLHGNWLIDCRLSNWSRAIETAATLKLLPGVLDTSLFAGICKKAVIAGSGGARIVAPVQPLS